MYAFRRGPMFTPRQLRTIKVPPQQQQKVSGSRMPYARGLTPEALSPNPGFKLHTDSPQTIQHLKLKPLNALNRNAVRAEPAWYVQLSCPFIWSPRSVLGHRQESLDGSEKEGDPIPDSRTGSYQGRNLAKSLCTWYIILDHLLTGLM